MHMVFDGVHLQHWNLENSKTQKRRLRLILESRGGNGSNGLHALNENGSVVSKRFCKINGPLTKKGRG